MGLSRGSQVTPNGEPLRSAEARVDRGSFTALDWIAVVLVGLLALALLVAQVAVTPAFGKMYADFEAALPFITRLVVSGWFALLGAMLPLALLVAGVVSGGTLAFRRTLVVAAFVLGLLAVGIYGFGLYAPLRQLATDVAE